jgi:gas vesicle protein
MSNSRIYYSHEAETKAMRRMTLWTVFLLVLGLSVGAMVALLYAPKEGEKMRRQLAKNIEEGISSGQEALEPTMKKLEKEVGELRHTVEDSIAKMR